MSIATAVVVKKRTLRRQQKNQLIKEAQQDIDTVEALVSQTPRGTQTAKGLNILLDILYVHCQELINSEV